MRAGASLLLLAVAGCGGGVDPGTGLGAWLRVTGGQYFHGAMPVAEDGPEVHEAPSVNNVAFPGQRSKHVTGTVAGTGRAVAVALAGDAGFWTVPVSAHDVNVVADYLFDLRYSLAPEVPVGPQQLLFRAVDDAGRFGPAKVVDLTIVADAPTGALVVSLAWRGVADLDLHVVQPSENPKRPAPIEIWANNASAYESPRPGDEPETPEQIAAHGILDVDSNPQCVFDGRDRENVVWKEPPPGHYVVRVDAPSLCGDVVAAWSVTATAFDLDATGTALPDSRRDLLGRSVQGQAVEADTRFPHTVGAGITAAEFDLP